MANMLSRRCLVGASAIGGSAFLTSSAQAAFSHPDQTFEGSPRVINIMAAPYNADPFGNNDCAPAFQKALNALSALGGGMVIVPPGDFALDFPVASYDGSITIWGAGKALSVFLVRHAGVAFTFNCSETLQSIDVHHVGFSPVPTNGGLSGTALALLFPPGNSGWMHASISNVDLGVARPGYLCFTTGIKLANCYRGNFDSITMHGNHLLAGTTMFLLTGKCIDNRILNSFVDNMDLGVHVEDACEGLTVSKTEMITNRAVYTGNSDYGNGVNLLGLYISNCELNCYEVALPLFQVNTGWIAATHCGGGASGAMVSLVKCNNLQLDANLITGHLNDQDPAQCTGIETTASVCCMVDSNLSINVLTGLVFGPGTTACTSIASRMVAPGDGSLVAQGYYLKPGWLLSAFQDNSGNSTNFCQWISSQGVVPQTPHHSHSHTSYSADLTKDLQ